MSDLIGTPRPFPFDAWIERFRISPAQGRALIALQRATALPSRTMQALARQGFARAIWNEQGARREVEITPVGRAALEWLEPLTRDHKGGTPT